VETAIGVFVGAVITWLAAWWYYRKASEDLLKESIELRRLNKLMLLGMEHAGWVKLTKDNDGNILGFEQVVEPSGIASAEAVGIPTIIQGHPKN
jgi:hypothetical protein